MKLFKMLENSLFGNEGIGASFGHEHLNGIKDLLMKCDEFKNVKELVIIPQPFIEHNKGKTIESQIVKISKDDKVEFGERVYLWAIFALTNHKEDKEGNKEKEKSILVRGVFEQVDVNGTKVSQDIGDDVVHNEEMGNEVFYYFNISEKGAAFKSKILPKKYASKWGEKFGVKSKNVPNLSDEQMEEFILECEKDDEAESDS